MNPLTYGELKNDFLSRMVSLNLSSNDYSLDRPVLPTNHFLSMTILKSVPGVIISNPEKASRYSLGGICEITIKVNN
jgi:hypothetical protein